jgi:hypothetical protein
MQDFSQKLKVNDGMWKRFSSIVMIEIVAGMIVVDDNGNYDMIIMVMIIIITNI